MYKTFQTSARRGAGRRRRSRHPWLRAIWTPVLLSAVYMRILEHIEAARNDVSRRMKRFGAVFSRLWRSRA